MFFDTSERQGDLLRDGRPIVISPRLFQGKLLLQETDTGGTTELTQTEGSRLPDLGIRVLQHGLQ